MMTAGCAMAQEAAAPSLMPLAKWEGKLPAGSPDFWEDKALLAAAEKGLTAGVLKKFLAREDLAHWGYVERHDQYLLVPYCVQHACGYDNINVFINMEKGTVSACLHGLGELIGLRPSIESGPREDYWISNGRATKLGYNSCKKLGYYAPKAYEQK